MIGRMPQSDDLAVSVRPVTPELDAAVRALRVHAAQYVFVGDVAASLADVEATPHSEAMAVLAGDQVVGFYRVDLYPGAIAGGDYGSACALLRSLMIDRRRQGRGLGTRALRACCADLERRHPRLRLLALAVNCANSAALGACRRAGFVHDGLYFGGNAGPQHLMQRKLGADPA